MRRAAHTLAATMFVQFGATAAHAAPAATPAERSLVAIGAPGAQRVAVLDCASGEPVASGVLPAALTAEAALAPDGSALYVATRERELLRFGLPGFREQARVPMSFDVTVLASAAGADAIVLAGGRGDGALSAHDPDTLAELQRYRLPAPFAVSAIRDTPARRRLAVAFADVDEAWEIAYDRNAPPVLQGLVHDYRSNEAVPLPGRLTPRRFELPNATRALLAGPAPYELARLDASGALGIVHLDVRRQIERPATKGPVLPGRIAAWRDGARRGWLIAAPGASDAQVLEVGSWRVTGRVDARGEILALAASGDRGLVAHASEDGVAVSPADAAKGVLLAPLRRLGTPPLPLRFVAGSGDCVALLDRDDRWLAGFVAPPLR
jgi:hypothetical protein